MAEEKSEHTRGATHDEGGTPEKTSFDAGIEDGALDLDYLNDTKRNRRFTRRADLRVMPLLAFMYLLNFLDRGNVGNAKVLNQETGDSLIQQTHMTSKGYSIAITLFSLAYALFEVPSNWIMKRYVRPSLWMGFLLFCWGVSTIGFAGVKTYAEVVGVRFLIGVFEAGFFPGIVYYITFWYRVEERALRVAFVIAHANLAGAFGGCIAYGMGKLNGVHGLEGFRWLFIVEGLITAVCVLLTVLYLPDYPSRAKWLSEEEKVFADKRLQVQGGGYTKAHATRKEILETCFSTRMMTHYVTYIFDNIPLASFTFYTSTIVTGLGFESLEAQLLTIPPWVVGYLVSLALSFSADHFNARGWHSAFASVVGGIGWLAAGCLPAHAYAARYGCLILASCGAFPVCAPLSAWVTCNVPSMATMFIATALNNSSAGIAQIVAQWIWKAEEADVGYPTGNFTCAACSFAVAILSIVLRFTYSSMNKRDVRDASGNKRVWAL